MSSRYEEDPDLAWKERFEVEDIRRDWSEFLRSCELRRDMIDFPSWFYSND